MRCWLLEIRTVKILSKHSVQFSVNEKFLQYAKFDQPYFVEKFCQDEVEINFSLFSS